MDKTLPTYASDSEAEFETVPEAPESQISRRQGAW